MLVHVYFVAVPHMKESSKPRSPMTMQRCTKTVRAEPGVGVPLNPKFCLMPGVLLSNGGAGWWAGCFGLAQPKLGG